ncbi:MAG: DUF2691 family protein [Clostridia bacterium]|nr:DUF2691 family protein [Clostridia bacterium]
MIGLSFILPNMPSDYLYKVFSGVKMSHYKWNIVEDEVLYSDMNGAEDSLFKSDVVDATQFSLCVSRKDYYLVFLDMKAFPLNCEIKDIQTYDEYLNSSCEIVFLCADSCFVDIYSKNKTVLQKIYDNCVSNDFEVNIITKENDTRTKMSVL